MEFTVDEAYEAWKDGDSITVEPKAAEKICSQHHCFLDDFIEEQCNGIAQDEYCAWTILGWLGY